MSDDVSAFVFISRCLLSARFFLDVGIERRVVGSRAVEHLTLGVEKISALPDICSYASPTLELISPG